MIYVRVEENHGSRAYKAAGVTVVVFESPSFLARIGGCSMPMSSLFGLLFCGGTHTLLFAMLR